MDGWLLRHLPTPPMHERCLPHGSLRDPCSSFFSFPVFLLSFSRLLALHCYFCLELHLVLQKEKKKERGSVL